MPRVILPLAQGFEEIELVSIADVLRRGNIDVIIASIHSSLEVVGAHDIVLKADTLLSDLNAMKFDAICMHGGMEGVGNLLQCQTFLDLLVCFYHENKIIGAICAAPIILDQLKLLRHDFCCYPGCEKEMRNTQGVRLDQPFVFNHPILTGTGPAFAISFALKLVELLCGKDSAEKLSKELLINSF